MSFLSFLRKPAGPSLIALITAGTLATCESNMATPKSPKQSYNTPQDSAAIQSMPGELLPLSISTYGFGETWQIESYQQTDTIHFSSGQKRAIEVTCTYLKPNAQRPEGPLFMVKRKTTHFRNDSAFVVTGDDVIPAINPTTRSLCNEIREEIRAIQNDANEQYIHRSTNPIKNA